MNVIEYSNISTMTSLLDQIKQEKKETWIIACIKREYLKPMTNEALLAAIKPGIHRFNTTRIYWDEKKLIYVAWEGDLKATYKSLRGIVTAVLVNPALKVEPSSVMSYIVPHIDGAALKEELTREAKKASEAMRAHEKYDPLGFDEDIEEQEIEQGSSNDLVISAEEVQQFNELRQQRPYRKNLQVLVMEDQIFSQKLLCEIIRSSRPNNRDSIAIDAVTTMQDAWKLFIKKAHDIAFIDLLVPDGSGHALAQAIKELDPVTHVIIVTVNNYDEEINVAQQNNVDGFVAKPYNKKQIIDCIDKYTNDMKSRSKGTGRGSADRLR